MANLTKNSCAARATPTYSAISETPTPRNPAASRPASATGTPGKFWCAAAGWTPPDQPWPLIAIEEPCAIRGRALTVLGQHGIRVKVVGDAAYLAGVLNAARAGLGVTLLALAGPPPEGLIERLDLPAVPPIGLTARARPGADPLVASIAFRVLRNTLAVRGPRERQPRRAG